MRSSRTRIAAALIALAFALPLQAQSGDPSWDARSPQLTRTDLQEMLARFEETAASSAYSSAIRERARREAELIRERLEEGDIRIGDRIHLMVQRHAQLSDTFPVLSGRVIRLPEIGEIPMDGVLRSEVEAHLTEQIGKYVRDPVVRVRSLIRLELLGAVGQPGFYTVPSDVLLTDALMIAGGPGRDSNLEKLRIQRGTQTIWEGERLRAAVVGGRTLDQLNIRAGDSIYLPEKKSFFNRIAPITGILGAVTSLVLIGTRVF